MNGSQDGKQGTMGGVAPPHGRLQELAVFLTLAILIWPVLAAILVGGYGFAIWIFQIVFGPAGPAG